MEDILLYMNKENNCLPYLILDDGAYKFVGDFKDPVRFDELREIDDNSFQIILPIESILDENYFVNSNGVIEYRKPYCTKCNSYNIIKKDFNWRFLCLENGVPIRVKVKRYFCKKCKKKFQVEFNKHYEKYCNFSNIFKDKIVKARENGWISLRNIKRLIKDWFNVNISHESIRKALLVEGEFYYFNENVKLSGYYGYDEQWEKVSGKWIYYLVIFDLVNNVPVASTLSETLNEDLIKNFIDKSIPFKDRIAIVTDLKPEYDKIMEELGFIHQHCTFHLEKNIKSNMEKKINKDMINYRLELKNTVPELSDDDIDEMVKNKKEESKSEIWDYIAYFMELFKQPSFNDAIDYVNHLKEEINYFPKHLCEYLKKNFFPEYRKFLRFLEEDYKNKLDSTNNKIENFNGNTMPKYEKRSYKTKKGLWSALMHKAKGWIKRRKQDLTN